MEYTNSMIREIISEHLHNIRDGGSMMGSRAGYPREMIDPYWDRR